MDSKRFSYVTLLLIHAAIGFFVFLVPSLTKIYTISIFGFGIYYIVKTRNRNNEALILSAYVVGVEVLLRMTDGMFFNDFAKYTIMIFLFTGMIFTGLSKNSYMYWLFLVLLVPGIVVSTVTLNFETNIRKAIAFNITGPVCLGISAIYCYQRQITFERLKDVITAFCMPLVAILVNIFLFAPSVKEVVTGTYSNFETSGGYGPNQMATVLGFGIFLFFVQMLLNSPTKKLQLINAGLVLFFAFRGVVTFSRGGVITGIVMIVLLLGAVYFYIGPHGKFKIGVVVLLSFLGSLVVWSYSSMQTSGYINKRYANEDAAGRKKASRLSGREELIETEFQMFLDNPILGIGVGKNREYREQLTGIDAASHNEITRMMAEHGSLGILGLLILLFTPLTQYLDNKQNLFILPFLAFWILTINHAAMRLAAPAFVYGLSLIKVISFETPTVHRE